MLPSFVFDIDLIYVNFHPWMHYVPATEAQMMSSHDLVTKLPSFQRWNLFIAILFNTDISNMNFQ